MTAKHYVPSASYAPSRFRGRRRWPGALRDGHVVLICCVLLFVVSRWWAGHSHLPALFDASKLGPIPKAIWQVKISFREPPLNTTSIAAVPFTREANSPWLTMNEGYNHTIIGDAPALSYVREHYGEPMTQLLLDLPNNGARADLIRYLVLGIEGGIYSDMDTWPLHPIDEWVPAQYKNKTKLVVGIEWDERDGDPAERSPDLFYPLQFCQWTLVAAPGHIVFANMVNQAAARIEALRVNQSVESVSNITMAKREILTTTGPAAWTEVVFNYIRSIAPEFTSLTNFSLTAEPRLVGDVLILPIDGFATGVPHSGAARGYTPDNAMIRHLFSGSWRTD